MHFKYIFYILISLILAGCSTNTVTKSKNNFKINLYSNKGFALVYDDNLYKKKIISKKLDSRSLKIFQKNLKKNTTVKIRNMINEKTLIAKVGSKASYPSFNNSVISSRIAKELNLTQEEPYIEIISIPDNSMFIAKRAKTYDEEKQVANKAPVDGISINDLNTKKEKIKKKNTSNFSYTIKIADFYYNKTALLMVKRIKSETNIKNPKILKLSSNKHRVYLGPFDNINSLQISFNDINVLEFENIEIIKND